MIRHAVLDNVPVARSARAQTSPSSVGFLRPRMGIGGSERLVTDAAIQLQLRGHRIRLFVPERTGTAQFPELAEHHIAFDTSGALLPSHVGGRLRAPLVILKTAYAAWNMSRGPGTPDVIFSDVVPHVIPLVKSLTGAPVLYFCHYPDLLLTRDGTRTSRTYRAYRGPLDRSEARGIAAADLVLANSRFTAAMVRDTFPAVSPAKVRVLNPGVRVPALHQAVSSTTDEIALLSISRFDPRKNLHLAVDALAALRSRMPADLFSRVRLVLAGYRDQRLPESVALVEALRRRAAAHDLSGHVRFVFSPREDEREALLRQSRCVLYTPAAEHFGYVPIEAMAAGRAVVAVNHGGPTETVLHGVTGWLCEPTADAFADAMADVVAHPDTADRMGCAGRDHVRRHFSLDVFGDALAAMIAELASMRAPGGSDPVPEDSGAWIGR